MMAVDWVPLKIREQSMALKVNHEIDFFNMSGIRLNIDIHFHCSLRYGENGFAVIGAGIVDIFLSVYPTNVTAKRLNLYFMAFYR